MDNHNADKMNNVVPLFEHPKMRSPEELANFMKENFPDVVVKTYNPNLMTDDEIKALSPFARRVILRKRNTKRDLDLNTPKNCIDMKGVIK